MTNETDPRAALADPVRDHFEEWGVHMCDSQHLAERGVLLVTEERLRDAARKGLPGHTDYDRKQIAAAIFAALSGEATE